MACALARGDPALVALLPQVEVIAEEVCHSENRTCSCAMSQRSGQSASPVADAVPSGCLRLLDMCRQMLRAYQ